MCLFIDAAHGECNPCSGEAKTTKAAESSVDLAMDETETHIGLPDLGYEVMPCEIALVYIYMVMPE